MSLRPDHVRQESAGEPATAGGRRRRQNFAARLRANVQQPVDIEGSDSDDSSAASPAVPVVGALRPGSALKQRRAAGGAPDAAKAARELNSSGLAALANRDLDSARQSLENAAAIVQAGAGGAALRAAVHASLGCLLLRLGKIDRALAALSESALLLLAVPPEDFDADAALAARWAPRRAP
jgi:hypothetical protein